MTTPGGNGIYLPVMGSFRNFGASIQEESIRAARNGSRAMAQEFTSGAQRTGRETGQQIASGLKSAQGEVARASQQLAKSRDKELDQSSALARATRDMETANSKARQTSAAAAAAADRLAEAERRAAQAVQEHGRNSTEAERAIAAQVRAQSQAETAANRAQSTSNAAQTATERRQAAERRLAQAQEETTTRATAHQAALEQLAAQQQRTGDETDRMNERIGQTGQESEEASTRVGKVKSALSEMGKAAMGAFALGGMVGAVTQAINVGNELTGALNNMKSVSGASAEEMARVSASARELGNDASLPGTSATKAATAMLELAKGGLSVQQSMEAARGTLALAAAAEVDAGQAAEIQANALNTFGLKADYAAKAADILANTANASSVEITDVAQALQAGGAVAAQYGISMRDTAAAIGVLGNAGIKGSDAGTLLKTALIHLAAPSEQASQALDELGVKAWDAQGKFVGMESLFGQLQDASKRMTPELYAQNTAIALGTDAARLAGVAASQGAEGYRKMAGAVDQNGAALEVANAKMQGLGGAWEKVQNSLESVFLLIYDGIQGPLTSMLNTVSSGIGFVTDFATAFAKFPGALSATAAAVGILTTAWVAYNIQQKLVAYGGLFNYLRLLAVQMYGVAAATWASTSAFLANPMVWVALAVAGLVAAFILLWKNVEGFRNFWIGAWNGIKTAFSAVWSWIKDAFNGLKDIFLKGDFTGALARAFGIEEDSPVVGFLLGLRDTAINVWNAIVAGAQFLWTGLQAVFGALVSFWQGVLFPVLSFLWSSILQPVFSAVMAGAQMLWSVVSFVFNAWVTFWTGVVFPVLRFLWNQVLAPVFGAVQTGVGVLWNIVKGVFNAWVTFYTGILFPILRFLWDSVISPIFGFIGNLISATWNGVIWPALSAFGNFIKDVLGPVFSWLWNDIIKPAWDGIGTAITFVIDNVVKPAFDGLKTALGAVGDFFGTVVEGIKTAWNKLKEYAAKPINFVIENVWNNGLAKGWNKIADFIPGLVRASTLQPVAFAQGGAVRGPGSTTSDSIPAVLSNGEHVLDAMDVSKLGGQGVAYAMRSLINRGAAFSWDTVKGLQALPSRSLSAIGSAPLKVDGKPAPIESLMPNVPIVPAFREGGAVDTSRLERPAWELQLENGHRAAKARNGNPYTWGNEDCSGYMSMTADAIINGGNGVRRWATGSFPGGQPFVPGLGRGFSVGVHDNPGGPGGGHTAGTLTGVGSYSTVNVESGGSHGNVAYGGPAVGADNAQWDGVKPGRFHLAIGPDGAFESGGAGGGAAGPSPTEQKGFIKNKVKDILNKFMNPAKSAMVGAVGSPPPEWLAIPPKVYDNSLNGAVDGAFKIADGLTSNLRTVYDAASSVADSVGGVVSSGVGAVTGLFRDQGGVLPTGTSLVVNRTGKKEWILNDEQWKKVRALMAGPAKLSKDDAVAKVMASAPAGTADQAAGPGMPIPVKPKTNGNSPGQSSYEEQTARAPEKAGAANAGGNAIDFGGDLLNQGVDALAGWAEKGVSAGITAGMTGAGIPGGGIAGELAGKGAEAAGKWAGHGVKTAINIAKGVTKDVAGFFGFGYDEFTDPFGAFKSVIGNVQGAESANQQTTTDPSAKTGAQSLAEESVKTESTSSKPTDANQGTGVQEVLTPEVKAAREANPAQLAAIQQVKARGGSKKDALTTLMVGQTETGWKNYANQNDPESLRIAHDAVGSNHDSVGYFQQRASWGSTADRMDPRKSTDLFLNQLLAQKDREKRSNAEVAQAVQRSAFADGSNYAKNQEAMQKLLDSLGIYDVGGVLPSGGLAMNTSGHDEYVVPPKAWGKLDDVLNSNPEGAGGWDEALAKELGRLTTESDGKETSGHGGPLIQIDKIEANDPTEAASALSKEARRLGRSNSLIGGR